MKRRDLPAIEAPANPPTNSILRVRMFSSCREIPQARTVARGIRSVKVKLSPRGVSELGPFFPQQQT